MPRPTDLRWPDRRQRNAIRRDGHRYGIRPNTRGAQTCADTPPVPAIVHLEQPFGDLTLLDGGRYPAVQVAANGQPTATSSPAAQVTAAPSPGPTYLVYVVKPGDSLSAIANRFNLTLWEIELANPKLTNPNHLEVGQSLNIPPPGSADPAAGVAFGRLGVGPEFGLGRAGAAGRIPSGLRSANRRRLPLDSTVPHA